jgi:hypothetical protein
LEFEAHPVMGRIRQIPQAILQAEDKQDGRKDTQGNAGVAMLQSQQGWAADVGPLGHGGRGDAPSFPGIGYILSQFLEDPTNRERNRGNGH